MIARIRDYRGRNSELVAERSRRSRQRYPEKVRAREVVKEALRSGALEKPASCPSCKRILPSLLIHAHHNDYSQPLDIEWLCTRCHGLRHRKD